MVESTSTRENILSFENLKGRANYAIWKMQIKDYENGG